MAKNKLLAKRVNCRIRVPNPIEGVFPEYQPENDKVYDTFFCKADAKDKETGFCVLDIKDKKIVVRDGEFEFVED